MTAGIRVVAVCVFRDGDRMLVFEGFDSVKQAPFYRPLGGGVEAGETAAEALTREIREEMDQEVADLRLLGVIENLFALEGAPGHEIMFVFDGRFVDPSVYTLDPVPAVEHNGSPLKAAWRPIASFDGYHRLVPEALMGLLR